MDFFGAVLFTRFPGCCSRFPNIGQSCYMNSSLQSLLALEDFIGDVVSMQKVWSFVPEAQLMRCRYTHAHSDSHALWPLKIWQQDCCWPGLSCCRTLVDIKKIHTSTDPQRKRLLLFSFKKMVSDQAPVFRSNLQNVSLPVQSCTLAPPADSLCVKFLWFLWLFRMPMSSWPPCWLTWGVCPLCCTRWPNTREPATLAPSRPTWCLRWT